MNEKNKSLQPDPGSYLLVVLGFALILGILAGLLLSEEMGYLQKNISVIEESGK